MRIDRLISRENPRVVAASFGAANIVLALCGMTLTLLASAAAGGQVIGITAPKSDGPVVAVTGGQVQGQFLAAPGGAVFKGIPYAAAPIGDLRWREPQAVKLWTGIRAASEYGADCPATEGHSEGTRPTSEDCLFLNVWTPEWPSVAKKAVIVWIHGGEFFGGTGTLPNGPVPDAAASLARHGVVLVSINYRPYLLGLMGHPALTAESPHHSSGNYTILDAIAALRWVHDNIARFGGDPGNVTVFGESDGAHITSFLITSPLVKGLISRAIIDSGAPVQYTRPVLSQQQLEQVGELTAKYLQAPDTDPIKYLRELPVSKIAAVSKQMFEVDGNRYDEGIDGYAIRESPAEVVRSHKEAAVPMIFGSTARDSTWIDGVSPLNPNASPEEVNAWVKHALEIFYGKYPDLLERAEKIYGLRDAPNEVSTYPPYGPIQEQLGVDLHHRCAVVTTALWHSAIASTWSFEFSRSIPSHGAEVKFVFGSLNNNEIKDESAHKLAEVMQQYWTNFAKTGDPNGPGLPVWPKYDATTKQSLDFTNEGPVQRGASRDVACGPYVDEMARLPKPLFVSAGPWPGHQPSSQTSELSNGGEGK